MRIKQLDGLRTIAVFLVLLTHHGMLSFGWTGVDLFFVLSGFLITGILRKDRENPFFWRSFYTKRATRILPPVIIAIIVANFFEGHFAIASLGYLFFCSNFLAMQPPPLSVGSLDSFWSLAVEEHFYLFWPFAVRFLSRDRLLKLSVAILIGEPLLRLVATPIFWRLFGHHGEWDSPIFLLTPFRIDGLAAGSLLALLLEDGRCPQVVKRWSGYSALASLSLFLGLSAVFHSFRRGADSMQFNSLGYSLIVLIAFSALAYLVTNPDSLFSRILASPIPVFVGGISYGVYLYQEFVLEVSIQLAHTDRYHSGKLLPIDLLIVVAWAALSFYVIEKPIIAWGKSVAASHRKKPSLFQFKDEPGDDLRR
jgi:peptidoglycan/LPS O-acetylase OafA/YrhL